MHIPRVVYCKGCYWLEVVNCYIVAVKSQE